MSTQNRHLSKMFPRRRSLYRSHLAASRHDKPASIFLMSLHADLEMKVLLGNSLAKLDCLGIMHIDLQENNFRLLNRTVAIE